MAEALHVFTNGLLGVFIGMTVLYGTMKILVIAVDLFREKEQ